MPSIRDQALEYLRSLTFQDLLQNLVKGLLQYGVEYLTDNLDRKLEEYNVSGAIRQAIKWGIRTAVVAFMAWFTGSLISFAVAYYIIGKLVKYEVSKLYHSCKSLPLTTILFSGSSMFYLLSVFNPGSSMSNLTLTSRYLSSLKLNLVEEIESDGLQRNHDYERCIRILKAS